MSEGIRRTIESTYWKTQVWPAFKAKYPVDAAKIEAEAKGVKRPLPSSAFARGIVEELRDSPLAPVPPKPPTASNYGLYDKPVVLLHNARGGVEYQDEQVKYFGCAMLDLNSPTPWAAFKARAERVGLRTVYWWHCHSYADVEDFMVRIQPDGTGGLNLEDIANENMTPERIAGIVDRYLPKAILSIPTLGWIQNFDWSPLNRHVFQLEFFLNDPRKAWVDVGDDVLLVRQLAEHARACGCTKITFLCGAYDASATNPYARTVTPAYYKQIIAAAGERYGGLYLGDNVQGNYQPWWG